MKDKELIEVLHTALEAARDHLEYCDYGDDWENDRAHENNLPDQLTNAIGQYNLWKSD